MTYVQPTYGRSSFTCPHCEAITGQTWQGPWSLIKGDAVAHVTSICQSKECARFSIWVGPVEESQNRIGLDAELVWPPIRKGPKPNPDLDADIEKDFQEARSVIDLSPRAAAALLRLALQKLMVQLDQPGENINADIARLIKEGLRPDVAQALDVVRVTGNDAVHPGQIDTDDPETVLALFDLLNIIAEDRISQPAKVKALFEALPDTKKQAIETRDSES